MGRHQTSAMARTGAQVDRPPLVPGTAAPRLLIDAAIATWWTVRALWLLAGRRKSPMGQRAFSLLLAMLCTLTMPLLCLLQAVRFASPRTRVYFSGGRDALLVISSSRHGWHVGDHVSADPGTGAGGALRQVVLPVVLHRADQQRVAVTAVAATSELAAIYCGEVPGLHDVGPGFPRGRRLRRTPGALDV